MKTVSKSKLLLSVVGVLFSICVYAQVPVYNSYPSASATIFLDFDGHYLEGTSWNFSGPISVGPSNLTNSQITEIFERISEDYRPFNINVTTDSTKYWSSAANKRMRVIFTITSDWYGNGAGGVSYINSFSWGDNTPCFVFTALLNYNTKIIAEAGSHEAGHTLGLNHQSAYDANCNKIGDYNYGQGSGEIGWAPIMGAGYYRNFTLWHNGSNPWGCTSYQDDLSIITSTSNGFGYRPDDFSGTVSNKATQLNFVNNNISVSGVIETVADKDVFKFSMPTTGRFHLDANPYSVGSGDNGSNLDVKLQLLTSSNTVVNTYNPDLLLSATIDTTLDAGTYYLTIEGSGNIYAPDYASLGSYNLSGTYSPLTVLPVHRLELSGINSETGRHELSWIIDADEKLIQQKLETSVDGKNFTPVGSLNTETRSYSYLPSESSIIYYRLHAFFENNTEYYSNILVLKNTTKKPSVNNNLVHNSLQVNSPSPFIYTVIDFSGKTVSKGNLIQGSNSISTANLGNGMYIVQFSNGQEQYAQKFIKQ